MTKFEQYKAAIRLVGGWMIDRMEAVLLSGHGDVLSDELGALTGLMEGALQQYLQKQDPADLEAVTGAERDETGMYDLDVAHRPSMACADRARGVRRWRSSGPRPWPGGPPGPSPGRPAMAVFGSMTLAWWPAQT